MRDDESYSKIGLLTEIYSIIAKIQWFIYSKNISKHFELMHIQELLLSKAGLWGVYMINIK